MLLQIVYILATLPVVLVISCASFTSTNVSHNGTLTFRENDEVIIPFRLNTIHCTAEQQSDYYVYVSHQQQSVCALSLGRTCKTHTNSCWCSDINTGGGFMQEAVFQKTAAMSDGGLWVWKSGDGSIPRMEVTFVVVAQVPISTVDKLTAEVQTFHQDILTNSSEATSSSLETLSNVSGETAPTLAEIERKAAVSDWHMSDAVLTGIIVASVNLLTIIFIIFVFFLCYRKRVKKQSAIGQRLGSLPRTPRDVVAPNDRRFYDVSVENRSSAVHLYQDTQRPLSSRIYEEIAASELDTGLQSGVHTYLTPEQRDASESPHKEDTAEDTKDCGYQSIL